MPELPEVETIIRQLTPAVLNKTVKDVIVLRENVVANPQIKFSIKGRKFTRLTRKGKLISLGFDDESIMTVHLRMTGKLVVADSGTARHRFDRVIFQLNDSVDMRYNDSRTLGKLDFFPGGINSEEYLASMSSYGVDALSNEMTPKVLLQLIEGVSTPIKVFLLNQKKIAGIGNIYASELLFRLGINPLLPAKDLPSGMAKRFINEMKALLNEAINKSGTTISDFRGVDDKTGEFQNFLNVYDRKSEPCKVCGNLIERIVLGGRSTYFCQFCQKL